MMLMNGRRILTVLALASHAAMSLCGPGHHALDGVVAIERFTAMEGSAVQDSGSRGTDSHTDEDCPACHFFSLASLPTSFAPAMIRSAVDTATVRTDPVRASLPFPSASSPRAPPQRLAD